MAVKQLHEACRGGQLATIRQLLDGGVPADALIGHDRTPLYRAIKHKQREAVELLLDRGANIEAVSAQMTPLLSAIYHAKSEEIAGLLLDRGASPHAVCVREGSTTLHGAAYKGFSSSWAG